MASFFVRQGDTCRPLAVLLKNQDGSDVGVPYGTTATLKLVNHQTGHVVQGACTLAPGNPAGVASTVDFGSNGVNLNTFAGAGVLYATSTEGAPPAGTLTLANQGGAVVSYLGVTGYPAPSFTGCTLISGSGTVAFDDPVIATTANLVTYPFDNPADTAQPGRYDAVWSLLYPTLPTNVASGSNNVNIATFEGAGILNVASTSRAPTVGVLTLPTHDGATVSYTGITATSFTGCTLVQGTGTLITTDVVLPPGTTETFPTRSGRHLGYTVEVVPAAGDLGLTGS